MFSTSKVVPRLVVSSTGLSTASSAKSRIRRASTKKSKPGSAPCPRRWTESAPCPSRWTESAPCPSRWIKSRHRWIKLRRRPLKSSLPPKDPTKTTKLDLRLPRGPTPETRGLQFFRPNVTNCSFLSHFVSVKITVGSFHSLSLSSVSSSSGGMNPNVTCFHCGRSGHKVMDCRCLPVPGEHEGFIYFHSPLNKNRVKCRVCEVVLRNSSLIENHANGEQHQHRLVEFKRRKISLEDMRSREAAKN